MKNVENVPSIMFQILLQKRFPPHCVLRAPTNKAFSGMSVFNVKKLLQILSKIVTIQCSGSPHLFPQKTKDEFQIFTIALINQSDIFPRSVFVKTFGKELKYFFGAKLKLSLKKNRILTKKSACCIKIFLIFSK